LASPLYTVPCGQRFSRSPVPLLGVLCFSIQGRTKRILTHGLRAARGCARCCVLKLAGQVHSIGTVLVLSSSCVEAVPIQLGQFRFVLGNMRRYGRLAQICFAWQLLSFVPCGLQWLLLAVAVPCLLWQRFVGQFLKTQTGCGQHNKSFKATALRASP
jgi:hypothetical protein